MPVTRIEQFNQLLRGLTLLAFVGAFIYGFLVSKLVGSEAFLAMFGIVITWYFKSRDEQQQRADLKSGGGPTNGTTTPTPIPGPEPPR